MDEIFSCTSQRWRQKAFISSLLPVMTRQYAMPEIIAKAMLARGVTPDTLKSYISPRLDSDMPDPSLLRDMDRAAERIAEAVVRGEHVYIYGDYDVDGATSAAVLYLFLKDVGAKEVSVRIPERNEGYDADSVSMRDAKAAGVSLVITVDCGTTAFDAVDTARGLGMDVVILDHHEPTQQLPSVNALVNPKRHDEPKDGPFRHLAAVGVVFMTVVAISRVLREFGWYGQRNEPDLRQWLDLVALGTICDVVRLQGINRLFVKSGTGPTAGDGNAGIRAVCDLLNVKRPLNPYHFGFVIGPRINAGGRVGASNLGFRLLTSRDAAEALKVAEELDSLNLRRREIEADVMAQALRQLDGLDASTAPFVMTVGRDWQKGVIGIVAGRLRERYGLPSLVVTVDGSEAKGSGRSIDGIDLGRAIMDAVDAGVIVEGGGHAMAAGFTLMADRLDDFRRFMHDNIVRQLSGEAVEQALEYDAALGLPAVTLKAVKQLSALEPFGAGNEEPLFVLQNVRVSGAAIVGTGHVRCMLKGVGGGSCKAIAFRAADSIVGKVLLENRGEPLHVLGNLKLDAWNGRETPSITILDVARA